MLLGFDLPGWLGPVFLVVVLVALSFPVSLAVTIKLRNRDDSAWYGLLAMWTVVSGIPWLIAFMAKLRSILY